MDSGISRLDLTSLRGAVAALRGGQGVVRDVAWLTAQPRPVRETLLSGVIQNFEVAYEIAVKMIRRALEVGADSPADVDSADFRQMLRIAAERGLIDDVAAWFECRQLRNITLHTYNEAKRDQVLGAIPGFLEQLDRLHRTLETRYG